MKLNYRKAETSDAERIEALFIEMLQTIYHTDDVEAYEEGYLDKFFSGGDDVIYVAEAEGSIVAYLSVEVHREGDFIYLDDLSVTDACRDQGIGTKLIRMAEEYADGVGIPAIVFHVDKANVRAHQLYERLGYADHEDQGNRILMVKDKAKM